MSDVLYRVDQMRMAHTRERLFRSLHFWEETIVHHYARLAAGAYHTLELIKYRQYHGSSPEIDEGISRAVQALRREHIEAFGVEPSWWPRSAAAKSEDES